MAPARREPAGHRVVPAGRRTEASTRAPDHARWQRERADARARESRLTDDLAAAIDVGDARYLRLRGGLDDYGARLEAVRSRLYREAGEDTSPAGWPSESR
jgi:hypothetical protein